MFGSKVKENKNMNKMQHNMNNNKINKKNVLIRDWWLVKDMKKSDDL